MAVLQLLLSLPVFLLCCSVAAAADGGSNSKPNIGKLNVAGSG